MGSVSWKFNADGDWQDAGVWLAALPITTSDVTISTTAPHFITHNSGTDSIHGLTIGADTLTVNGGSLAIAGKLGVGAAGSLALAGGVLSLGASSTVAGGFTLTYGQLDLAAATTLTLSGKALLGGEIDGPGTLATSGTSTLDYYLTLGGGLAWTNTGAFSTGTIGYAITVGDSAGGTAALINAAGATFAFTSDVAISNSGTLGSTFANAGTLIKTGGTGVSDVFSALTSTGIIGVTSGTLELDGGGKLTGVVGTGAAGTLAFATGAFTVGTVTAGSSVAVSSGSVAVAGATTLNSLAITGGSVAFGAAATFTNSLALNNGTLSLAASATATGTLSLINGQLTLAKNATLSATGSGTVGGVIDGPGTLATSGTSTLDYYLNLGGGLAWNNTGAFNTGVNTYYIGVGDLTGGTAAISNAVGGTFTFTADSSITNFGYTNAQNAYVYGSSTFANAGTLAKTGGTGTSGVDSALTSTGTISVTLGTIALNGGGTLTGTVGTGLSGALAFGAGSFTVASVVKASNLVVSGGTVAVAAATTANTVTVNSGTLGFAAGVTFSNGLTLNGGTLSLAASSTDASGLTLNNAQMLLAKNVILTASGAVALGGNVDGPGTLATSGTTTLSNYVTLGGGVVWINTGAFNSGATAYAISAGDLAGGTAAIVNGALGKFDFTSDAYIQNNGYYNAQNVYVSGSSTFANAGTLAKTGGTGTSSVYSIISNTGTITAIMGTLAIDGGGALGGTIGATGAGTLALGGGTFTVAGAAQTVSGALVMSGGAIKLTGGKTLTLSGSDALTGTIDGPGVLVTSGTGTLAGPLTLGGALAWQNTGTFSTGSSYAGIGAGDVAGATASIVNALGATFALATDAGLADNTYNDAQSVSRTGVLTFANAGTLTKAGGTGTSSVYAVVSNTGTITATSGTLELDGGGVLAGTIGASGVGVISLATGTYTVSGTAQTISGTLELGTGNLRLATGQTLTLSGSAIMYGTTVDGPGTLVTSGSSTLTYQTIIGGGLVWNNTGAFNSGTQGYSVLAGDTLGSTATIDNAAGATFAFTADSSITNRSYYDAQSVSHVGGSTFANAGTVTKTAGVATSTVDSVVSNTGTITATSGTLDFDGGGALGGTIGATGPGTLALGGGVFTLANATQAISGAFNLLGGGIAVGAGQVLTLSGAAALGGKVDGPGTLVTSGTSTLDTYYATLGGGLAWNNTGTFNTGANTYGVQVGDLAGGTASITNVAGATFAFTSSAGVMNAAYTDSHGNSQTGFSTFANAGTLTRTGALSTSQIYSTFTNTGSILAGTGVIELDGGATLNGAVSSNSGNLLLNLYGFSTTTTLTIANNPINTAVTLASGQVWTNSGTIVVGGRVQIGNVAGGTLATLANQGTINLVSDSAGFSGVGVTSITNAGTFAKTAGIGTSSVVPAVTNTGTIDAASGTLKINSIVGAGTLRIEAASALELNLFTATQAIVFNGAGATLKLDKAAGVAQTLTNFGAGDRIDLVTVPGATATLAGNTLTAVAAGKTYTFKSSASVAGDVVVAGVDASGAGTVFSLYQQAIASLHTPEPVAFANHHVGDVVTQALSISNNGVGGGFAEKLDATLSSAAGGITVAGAITGLAGQSTDSSSLVVTLNTATAGAMAGTATLSLASDGTGVDNRGTTALASQMVTASGAAYALAAPAFAATTLDFGATRVLAGGTLAATSNLTNGAASAYQESLVYAATATGAFSPAVAGPQTLLAGGTGAVGFALSTTNAGDFTGSSGTVTLVSTGAGTSGLADSPLASQAIALNGKVYATAVAQIDLTVIDFGVTHVSATAVSQSVAVGNEAAGALTDLLTGGTLASTTGNLGLTVTSLASGVAVGAQGSLQFQENATVAGTFSGTAVVGFTSHDADLSDVAANSVTLTTTGTVDNYATAQFEAVSGGTLAGAGPTLTFNLGSVAVGGAALSGQLGVLNGATGQADALGGSFVEAGSNAYSNAGFATFAGLAAGAGATGDTVTLSSATAGVFTETVTLHSAGSNANYSGALLDQKVTVTGTIVASGQTYALTAAPTTIVGTTGDDTFTAAANALNSHDRIDGGAGVNTLNLVGAGSFDLGAPKTLLNIQAATVSEGVAGTSVYLRDALNLTLNVASGAAGAGITIYGGADASTINLGAGTDIVELEGAGEKVVANAAGGMALIQGVAATAGTLVTGTAPGTTLELLTGGAATLNDGDGSVRILLDAATNLALGKGSFIVAQGSAFADTITAGGVNQTLTGGGGNDTLVGSATYGDIFRDTAANLKTDLLKGFGGSDLIDATDLSFASLGVLKVTSAGTGATATSTLAAGGAHPFSVKLAGTDTLANFTAASDGHGGTQFSFH